MTESSPQIPFPFLGKGPGVRVLFLKKFAGHHTSERRRERSIATIRALRDTDRRRARIPARDRPTACASRFSHFVQRAGFAVIGEGRAPARIEPSRQPPHRINSNRSRVSISSGRIRSKVPPPLVFEANRRKTVAREIERVVFVSIGRGADADVRLPTGFRRRGHLVAARDAPDLEPSEDDVKFRRAADEAERASDFARRAESIRRKETDRHSPPCAARDDSARRPPARRSDAILRRARSHRGANQDRDARRGLDGLGRA